MLGVHNYLINARNNMMDEYIARNPNGIFAKMRANGNPLFGTSGNDYAMGASSITSFAEGGMMAPGGGPIRPGQPIRPSAPEDMPLGADAPTPMSNQQIEQEAQKFVQSNPQVVDQMRQVIAAAMQSGELTKDELNLAVQLAKTALANPASYPQIRQFAIENGLGTEQDIPQEPDRGLLFTLLVVGKGLQASGGNAMQGQPPAGIMPEYREGGMTGDQKHLAMLHPREYVVPEDALLYHGKKHFDKLIEQARAPKDGNQSS